MEILNYIHDKYKFLNRIQYIIKKNTVIEINSSSEKGLFKDLFSQSIITDSVDNPDYKIYVIETDINDIPEDIKQFCCKTKRGKNALKGYYNLHHFGSSLCYYYDTDRTFVIAGKVKDAKTFFWSYIIKLIIGIEAIKNRFIVLKGTAIDIKGNAFLFLGPKGAGKSRLVTELIKLDSSIKLIGNTHIFINKDAKIEGLVSNISFRKQIAQELQEKYNILPNVKIDSCINIDPLQLDFNICKSSSLKSIYFYEYNDKGIFKYEECNSEKMNMLIEMFSENIIFYGLQNDLYELYRGELLDFRLLQKSIIKNILQKIDTKLVTADCYSKCTIEELLKIIKGK